MEEIVKKGPVPAMPEEIKIQGASWGALPSQEIHDISPASIRDMVEKIRTGASRSLMLTPDEYGELSPPMASTATFTLSCILHPRIMLFLAITILEHY